MQSRFGLKDFVLMLMVAVVGVSVWMSMFQRDLESQKTRDVQESIDRLQNQVSQVSAKLEGQDPARAVEQLRSDIQGLREKIDSGVKMVGTGAPAGPHDATAPAGGPRDESWARPGVPIEWQPPWTFPTDPRPLPGFRTGGEFTEIFEAQLQKVTPFIQTDVYGRRIVDLVSQSLGAYDPKTLKFRGVLAEAWQIDPKGLWLRAKINPKARFSDGESVTAEDLRWTFHDFVMNQQIDAERDRSTLRDVIDKIVPISDTVVEFTFKEAFFTNLDGALTLFVLPKHFYSKFSPAEVNKATGLLMGSGPYRMERLDSSNQWTPPQDAVLVRNELYWGPPSPLEKLRFRVIQDELPRLTAYKNGEADMITPSTPQFRSLVDNPEWVRNNQCLNWVNMRSGNSFIAWNCGERNGKLTPFHDRRVRMAMTLLLDREKMIRDIWKGLGEISKGYFNPSSPGSDPALKAWPYDLNRAKELLKEAGWEDRDNNGVVEDAQGNEFTFEFTYTNSGEIAERIATFVKDACARAGIRCILKGIDWSVGEDIRKRRDFDATTLAWGANAPESDPKQIFHSESIKNQGDNFGQWSNPEADRLIEAGRRELDFDKRMVIWRQLERVMHDDEPYTWIRIQAYPRFIKPEIGNVHMYPKGLEVWEFYRGGPASPGPAN
jgi:peptide/nickel transport system substrate-binding protein